MYCDYFKCRMASKHCLEYQARARGESKANNSMFVAKPATQNMWQQKYKPCLNCALGKEIARNGGRDDDVEALKAAAAQRPQTKICKTCQREKIISTDPAVSEFYESAVGSGKFMAHCKACTLARSKAIKQARHQAAQSPAAPATIDQIASNNPAKPIDDAIQSPKTEQNQQDAIASKNILVDKDAHMFGLPPMPPVKRPKPPEEPEKICRICHLPKNINDFCRDQRSPDGRDSRCKTCRAASRREQRRNRKAPVEKTLTITLPRPSYVYLAQEALRELRSPEQQAAWLLREWAMEERDDH